MARPESSPAQRLKAEATPVYVAGSVPGEAWAKFRSGRSSRPYAAGRAARTTLARCAAERGDYAFGLTVLTRLRQYAEVFSPFLHITIAWLLIAEGHLADAVIEARTAAALDAWIQAWIPCGRTLDRPADGLARWATLSKRP